MKKRKSRYRRPNGIRLSAVVTLCLAASLLLFARMGGEDKIHRLMNFISGNGNFIAHAVALELGLSPDSTEVFQPRTTATARDEQASSPVAENTYIPAVPENDAPVLNGADKAATLTINNDTSYEVDVASCLSSNTKIRSTGDQPQVLIVHTHGSESYTPDAAFPYTPTETERTTDTRFNVVRVGDELQKVLEAGGVQAVHIRDIFDSPVYSGSYDRSLVAIEEALSTYPSIQIVIDIHRDSILTDSGEAYKTSCTIDGTEMAQLMFVVGTDDGGLTHPNWRDNLNYVTGLQYKLNRTYPQLMRPVNLRTQRFNQHASPGSMLVEVGSSGNTMTEALAAIRLFGKVLAEDLTGA